MYDDLKKQLDYLTKISGFEWKMPNGQPPSWIAGD